MELAVDGRKVYAATGGRLFDAAEPAVVFLHGAGLDHTVWALPSRYFAHHGRSVLAVDLPGHGRSEGPALARVDELGAWVIALLDAAGLDAAALVGHSLGATIAVVAAGRAPERVCALVLIGTGVPAPINPELLGAAEANDPFASALMSGWGFGRGAHFGGSLAPGIWMIGASLRTLERAAPGVLHTDLTSTDGYDGFLDAARRIRCPTLLLLGENDIMTPVRGARALAEAIADSRTVVLKDCGHTLMAEHPDEVLDALREVV